MKNAAEWFYNNVFTDEAIRPRHGPSVPQKAPPQKTPALLRTARSLEDGMAYSWQTREAIFIKQAKLLAAYEDDYEYTAPVVRYYPTYQSLTDAELRGYFTWRTHLRHGNMRKTSLSYAFLYIYELINQIGAIGPMDGYQKLKAFAADYGVLDENILPYLQKWLPDYVIYYGLDPALLVDSPQAVYDRNILVLANMHAYKPAQITDAVKSLSPRWLARSKFYAQNTADMDDVLVRVLRRVAEHYNTRCKKTFIEQYFGPCSEIPVHLFTSAVFHNRQKSRAREYALDEICTYRYKNGQWTVQKYHIPMRPNEKLTDLIKTVDAKLRNACGFGSPIKPELDTKWITKIIDEEVGRFVTEKAAVEAKKLHIDYSALARIRSDAAITRDKLTVDEELDFAEPAPEPPPPPIAQELPESPLSADEYRLMQCLLYGRDCGWVQAEGLMLSVLCDSINEKLYDEFMDSVLLLDSAPELIEDYIDDLKEMVHP